MPKKIKKRIYWFIGSGLLLTILVLMYVIHSLTFDLKLPAFSVQAVDIDTQFVKICINIDEQYDQVKQELLKNKILLVPGFLSNGIIEIGDISKKIPLIKGLELGQYFQEQHDWLTSQGFDVQMVDVESEGSIYRNADIIQETIEKSDKPVCIVAHSKGGLDTLQALIQDQQIWDKITCWVSIQTPFYGSPLADYVVAQKVLGKPVFTMTAGQLLEWMGGTEQSLIELQVTERFKYNHAHQVQIQSMLKHVPLLCVASYKTNSKGLDTYMEVTRDLMQNMLNLKNDGLVPWKSAVLKGSKYVVLKGVDHSTTVMTQKVPLIGKIGFEPTINGCNFEKAGDFDRIKFIKASLITGYLLKSGPVAD